MTIHDKSCGCSKPSPVASEERRKQVSEFYTEIVKDSDRRRCRCSDVCLYRPEDTAHIPEDVLAVSFGCGNPVSLSALKKGDTVLDIGSGTGLDCFIAAKKVGASGKVIGIDMTDEMLTRARANAKKVGRRLGYHNCEFRKGRAESIPADDNSVDLVLSNCVINLSPEKDKVYGDIFRIIRPGGRMMVSDIVSDKKVPDAMRADKELWGSCLAGALTRESYLRTIREAGFTDVNVVQAFDWKEMGGVKFESLTVSARKP